MVDDIICHFNFYTKGIKSDFLCKTSNTVREIIVKILKDTNSIMDYSSKSISVTYNTKILNKDKILDMPLSKVLKFSDLINKNFKISVGETEQVVGGFI